MLLTQKLLAFIHRVFDKKPAEFLALRLRYTAGMTWRVEDGWLYTTATGGPGGNLALDLSQYTLGQLVNHLAAQPGYSIAFADTSAVSLLSSRVLLDGAGNIDQSNGDHLYGYTSVLWAYLEAGSVELATARLQIAEMLTQISTRTADADWLDELGGYYAVPRLAGELDNSYGPRIIAEVLRPRGNNVAIGEAIKVFTGQTTTVDDVVEWTSLLPNHNAANAHDGTISYSSAAVPIYGLFDVNYGYDLLNGGDIADFHQVALGLVNRLRDGGTHLRSLLLTDGTLSDSLTAPTDGSDIGLSVALPLDDSFTAPTDGGDLAFAGDLGVLADDAASGLDGLAIMLGGNLTYGGGIRLYDGSIPHIGLGATVEDVGTAGDIPFSNISTLSGGFTLDGSRNLDGLI